MGGARYALSTVYGLPGFDTPGYDEQLAVEVAGEPPGGSWALWRPGQGHVAAALAEPSTSAGQVMLNAMPAWVRRRFARLGPDRAGGILVVLGLLPVAIDGFYQLFSEVTHYESTNVMRLLTGVPGGFVGRLLVGAMLISIQQFRVDLTRLRAHTPPQPK